jgi:hypothetical protein
MSFHHFNVIYDIYWTLTIILIKTTGSTYEAGTTYPSGAPEFMGGY